MTRVPSIRASASRRPPLIASIEGRLGEIGVPTLVIQAEDDTLIPFATFSHRAFRENPQLHLLSTPHGGHLGFLSRNQPRFWADGVIVDWFVRNRRNKPSASHVHTLL